MKISDLEFTSKPMCDSDTLYWCYIPCGRITVLDRETGFSFRRDIETGFKHSDGRFWLASGNFDIRQFPDLELCDAVEMIKRCANNYISERDD